MPLAKPSKELLESISWHQQQSGAALRMALLDKYEFYPEDAIAPDSKFMLPVRVVYRELANGFGIGIIKKAFQAYCRAQIEQLGGVYHMYCGRTFFRGMKRIGVCEAQSTAETKEYKDDARYSGRYKPSELGSHTTVVRQITKAAHWEKLLAAEGLPAEIEAILPVNITRAEMNSYRIENAVSAFWRVHRDMLILRCYTEGLSIMSIAERLKIGRKLVWNRLKHYDLTTSEK